MSIAQNWLLATRPKTLPAGLIPVVIGSSLAYSESHFNFILFLITILCSLLIQIITNFVNEIYDFRKGADNSDRIGPQRQVASGNISERTMISVSIVLFLFTFLLGLILVWHAGYPILIIGIVSLAMAYAYTGGPYPLAYKGLSDIFVLVFFGFVAVCGTYYIQTLQLTEISILSGLGTGLFATNILGVNNIRDIETDINVNKMTLAVRIGRQNAMILYAVLTAIIYLSNISIFLISKNIWNLLPLLTMPFAFLLCKKIFKSKGSELTKILEDTGKLLLIYGLLMSLGFILRSK